MDSEFLLRLKECNVLFIKGNSDAAEEEQKVLGRFFENLEVAESVEEALPIHEIGRFDIIYVPISLPKMNAIEFIKNIKNYDKNQKFIVLIGKKEVNQIFDLIKLNISSFIARPLAVDNFLQITRATIESVINETQGEIDIQQAKLAQTGEMISMIAHQWRQPLSAITAIIASIQTRIDLDIYKRSEDPYEQLKSEFHDAFIKIEDSAEYLSKTINDFRDYYSTESITSSINLSQLIGKVCRMALMDNYYRDIELQVNIDHTIVLTIVENELKQVLINIINNAKDAMNESSIKKQKLRITLQEGEKYVYINVVDNGGGIPKEVTDKIFLPYFSTKSKKNGTGIGLHMAKTIIEKHMGGTLSVTNNKLFGGADFCIKLPLNGKERSI